MISLRKVIDEIASKWQINAASLKRKKNRRNISTANTAGSSSSSSSSDQKCKVQVTQKGHFVVYSSDNKRFVMPLHYLNHNIFKELLKMSEDEFGLPCTGPIVLPCDAVFMEFIISLVKQDGSQESLISMIAQQYCSSYSSQDQTHNVQRISVPSF